MTLPAPAYGARFDDAVALAVSDFRARYRKHTTTPYITHLFAVTAIVGEYGGDEDQLIAAVLHDWLEDVPGAHPHVLERRFGPRVRKLIDALSDSVGTPKPPWRARKEAYIAHLRGQPAELKLISAADKLHNCQCIRRDLAELGDEVWKRFSGSRSGTLWYYLAVSEALSEGWDHPLAVRLAGEVATLLAESGVAAEEVR